MLNPAHRCGGVARTTNKKKGDVLILTYAFYISSKRKGDVINKQILIWKQDDNQEAKDYGWDGIESMSSKISIEFPHLIKTIDFE